MRESQYHEVQYNEQILIKYEIESQEYTNSSNLELKHWKLLDE